MKDIPAKSLAAAAFSAAAVLCTAAGASAQTAATASPSPQGSATSTATTSPTPSRGYDCPVAVDPSGTVVVQPNKPFAFSVSSGYGSGPGTAFRIFRTSPGPEAEVHPGVHYGRENFEYFAVPENTTLAFRGDEAMIGHSCPDVVRDVEVAPVMGLNAKRNGARDYTFSGRVTPGRGQLVNLYRVTQDGERVLTTQTRVGANGTYLLRRRFTGSGRFAFQTSVGASSTNLAGSSAKRPTVIY